MMKKLARAVTGKVANLPNESQGQGADPEGITSVQLTQIVEKDVMEQRIPLADITNTNFPPQKRTRVRKSRAKEPVVQVTERGGDVDFLGEENARGYQRLPVEKKIRKPRAKKVQPLCGETNVHGGQTETFQPPKRQRKSRAKKVQPPSEETDVQGGQMEALQPAKRQRKSRAKKVVDSGGQGMQVDVLPLELGMPKPPRKPRAKKGVLPVTVGGERMIQSLMPDWDSPRAFGPPPPTSPTPPPTRNRKGRFTKAAKGKGDVFKPRRPTKWAPSAIVPNPGEGATTRRRSSISVEYRVQEENDAAIQEVLADIYIPSDGEGLPEWIAPELHHTVDSLETSSINLWDSVFRDDGWRTMEPIRRVFGFEATHPGGSLQRMLPVPTEILPQKFEGVYSNWTSRRFGWAVLVPNRFLSESSFHTGDTPSWTQGDVIGEGTHVHTGRRMVIVDLGGHNCERHMDECDVRVANGPTERATGSEGGHGYGWATRQHCFSPRAPLNFSGASGSGGGSGGNIGAGTGEVVVGEAAGNTEHMGDNAEEEQWGSQPRGNPIREYDVPAEEDGVDGMQNSTARKTFPKVSRCLPAYMLPPVDEFLPGSDDSEEDALPQTCNDRESSDKEWLPEFEDTWESDADFDVDHSDDDEPLQPGMEDWCMRPEAFSPVHLDMADLAWYYRRAAWNSTSVDFIRSRDNFTGPPPGLKDRTQEGKPRPERVFNLYWSDSTIDRIVEETNRCARAVLPGQVGDVPRTKGGPGWVDVDKVSIRGWLGICILMGCKKLPSIRHYWMQSEPFIHCPLISEVMPLRRWEAILRCLHLVNNDDVVRDTKDRRFDRIAKTRWLLDNFVQVSEEIYNLEREITVDECVIPYKGRYCFIQQFMKNKPIRFGIKLWLLASSKSRFVWRIEVYFGEGTGLGEHGLGYHVVQRMISGLEHRGHCLVVNNLFASVNLFHDLMVKGIWATGTVKRASKNLPAGLYRKVVGEERGSMVIRNHVHRQMGVVSWQDSKLVTLLSTAAAPWAPGVAVLRRIKGLRGQLRVPSSPMHTQYVEYMRGVDVTDQLRASYSSQLRCHKWWLKLFHFVVDQSLVNAYVTWVREMEVLGLKAMPHLAFKIAVGRHLVEGAIQARGRRQVGRVGRYRRPEPTHAHFRSKLRRQCVVCGHVQRWYCGACGPKWMCREQCYLVHHRRQAAVV